MPLDTNEPYGPEDGPGHPDQEPTPFRPTPAPRHELQGGWLEQVATAADNAQLHVHVSAASTNDAELDAMLLCLKACEGLNNQAKVRVCTWLTERLGAWRVAPAVFPTGYPVQPPPPLPTNPGF